ncbi:hypothetical protein [Marinobacter salarius]|jgi:hypothetical protein|uniref:hypothetical protein n=1 Tax=Marinobacter salarius TaxID=1420917 RepID=UPI000F857FDA|nr:hypothetical protein [Marinobacter salarius]AZR39528.1 hypothetical protein MTMN5_00045 [Marinobacter salarius]
MDEIVYPEVIGYGGEDPELFQDYYARWPDELRAIPRCVVEHWIHRHWDDFHDWIGLAPHEWTWECRELTNEEILEIGHFGDWIEQLHAEGAEYVSNTRRAETFIGTYMREYGTTPVPMIVAENAGHVLHPKGFDDDYMKEPYQLIEGHSRLGCLLGMIDSDHPNLSEKHKVWVVRIPFNQ